MAINAKMLKVKISSIQSLIKELAALIWGFIVGSGTVANITIYIVHLGSIDIIIPRNDMNTIQCIDAALYY